MPADWTPDIPCKIDPVRREALVIIAPRGSQSPPTTTVDMSDLRKRAWVLNPDGCGFRHALARSLAAIDEHLEVQFELDAAPQEHIAMVAAGVGHSIVPASALTQSPKSAQSVQTLTVRGFDFDLVVSMLWSDRCQPLPGTKAALRAIFEPRVLGPRLQKPNSRPANADA
jgi:hypothetical protein